MRTKFAARGYHGGGDGQLRRFAINGQAIAPKWRYVLAPGDTLAVHEAGGGGFGEAKARDRGAVVRDLAAGFVSAEGAKRDYGVGGIQIDTRKEPKG